MVGIGRKALRTAWYMIAVPGAAIGLNLLSDTLHATFSPRLRGVRRMETTGVISSTRP
jgi:peptide/nickel transport system permease protein